MKISGATAWVAPDLLIALALLSDTTVSRSAVDQEDLKSYWKSENRPHFSWWPTSLSKTILTAKRRLKGRSSYASSKNSYEVAGLFIVDFPLGKRITVPFQYHSIALSPTYLNTRTSAEIFRQSGKQDPFRHILKSSASMYKDSSSQFLRLPLEYS